MIFSVVLTVLLAFLLSWRIGFRLVPWLRALKMGQVINDIGPTWHKYKEGTPTMGGLMFIIGTVIAAATGYIVLGSIQDTYFSSLWSVEWKRLIINILCCLAFAAIGFDDDYHKIMNHQNMGLTAIQKIMLQILVSAFLKSMVFRDVCPQKQWKDGKQGHISDRVPEKRIFENCWDKKVGFPKN